MSNSLRPRVAVIGSGIAGLATAWLLRDTREVVLYERETRAGGHADTQNVVVDGAPVAVDTGFIVYNERNYPNLTGLFAHLDVATRASDMSFGVSIDDGRLEYAGGELSQMFAQKSNVLRPRFWLMVRDILRFYREAPALLHATGEESIGDWLARGGYGSAFIEQHLLPMGAAIWSASVDGMRAFPARHLARFFHNHGLLSLNDRPAWRTVVDGSQSYVARLSRDLPAIRLGVGVARIQRGVDGVSVFDVTGHADTFDEVVLACHGDQALGLLDQASDAERRVLGVLRCQDNTAVLHTDASLMPRRRKAWSAWNYLSAGRGDHSAGASITYWMNRLQGFETKTPVFVSLNPLHPPRADSVLRVRPYRHPQFDAAAMRALDSLGDIQGVDRVWFAGAWTGWGFHEDGIASAVRIASAMGVQPPWAGAQTSRDAA